MKDIDKLKKDSLFALEISPNTKTSIVNSDLNQLTTRLRRIGAKEEIVILVLAK